MIDATIIEAPIRRATDEGATPPERAQRDDDAAWTKKNDVSFYGYKNHAAVDGAHKLIRSFDVTDASVHDSQCPEFLIDTDSLSANPPTTASFL